MDSVRTESAKGAGAVTRDGGRFEAGLIEGFSIITKGEALGHGLWIDDVFLSQVVAAMAGGEGVRARFTHPSLCSDGIARKLGRAMVTGRDGDVVRGDLHFSKTSHTTPEGDLATYVMNLAEEDPELFGASIVFGIDEGAMNAFILANGGNDFQSPDPANVKNLPHARLSSLDAVDIVDQPAANPGGMFHKSEIPAQADSVMAYALGLSDDKPAVTFGVEPERLKTYVQRYLANNKLSISDIAADKEAATEVIPGLTEYMSLFPNGAVWFSEGKTLAECYEAYTAELKAELSSYKTRLAAALSIVGEDAAVSANPVITTPDTKTFTNNLDRIAAGIKLPKGN